jgi:glycosyltransferase involved in cell wall biosynthesis
MIHTIDEVYDGLLKHDVQSRLVRAAEGYAIPDKSQPGFQPVPGLVTVVTVCLNGERYLQGAIDSVRRQTYPNIEHIIVDAESKDATHAIIRAAGSVTAAISLRDRGIADGFNRGVALARGEYVAFHNVDDLWPADHIVNSVAVLAANPSCAFVYGDLVRFDPEHDQMYMVKGEASLDRAMSGWPPEFNHPSFLTRYAVFERHGLFSLDYRVCMDLDWLVRLLKRGEKGIYANENWVIMRCGGISDNAALMYRDVAAILKRAGVSPVKVDLMRLRAGVKDRVKQMLQSLVGQDAVAGIKRRINPNVVAPDASRLETARQLLGHARAV